MSIDNDFLDNFEDNDDTDEVSVEQFCLEDKDEDDRFDDLYQEIRTEKIPRRKPSLW